MWIEVLCLLSPPADVLYIGWVSQQSPFEIIDAQRALVARLQAELDQARIQLEGMEKIFGALPIRRRSPTTTTTTTVTRKADTPAQGSPGGRQPGAISMRWRTILNALHREGKPFSPQRATEIVKELEGRLMKPSEAKRILEGYLEHGYVKKVGWSDFEVTDEAAEKFDFQGADDFDQLLGGDPPAAPKAEAVDPPQEIDPVFPTLPATPNAPGSQARHG